MGEKKGTEQGVSPNATFREERDTTNLKVLVLNVGQPRFRSYLRLSDVGLRPKVKAANSKSAFSFCLKTCCPPRSLPPALLVPPRSPAPLTPRNINSTHRARRNLMVCSVGRVVVALLSVAHHRRHARELVRMPRVGVGVEEDGETVKVVCAHKMVGFWIEIRKGEQTRKRETQARGLKPCGLTLIPKHGPRHRSLLCQPHGHPVSVDGRCLAVDLPARKQPRGQRVGSRRPSFPSRPTSSSPSPSPRSEAPRRAPYLL